MIARIVFLITVLTAFSARADWVAQGPGHLLDHSAMSCAVAEDGEYCLEVGCRAGGSLQFLLNALYHSRMSEATRVRLNLSVQNRLMPAMDFRLAGEVGIFEAPFEERHLEGLDRLKAGRSATAIFWMGSALKGAKGPVSLRGSSKAIDAVLAACPLPDFAARDLARRTSDNPRQSVRDEMAEMCADIGGEAGAPEKGFAREIDLDGAAPPDLLINHGAVPCSTAATLVCGSAGCVNSLWVGQSDGSFVRVLKNNIYGVTADGSGRITVHMHGGACGLAGAAECAKDFRVTPTALEPLD